MDQTRQIANLRWRLDRLRKTVGIELNEIQAILDSLSGDTREVDPASGDWRDQISGMIENVKAKK